VYNNYVYFRWKKQIKYKHGNGVLKDRYIDLENNMEQKNHMNNFEQKNIQKKRMAWKMVTVTVCALTVAVIVLLIGLIIGNSGDGSFSEDGVGSSVGVDKIPPVIKGPSDSSVVVYTGETVSFRSFVSATDNSGSCDLTFDESQVNINAEGAYEVTYTATDKAGNKSTYVLTVLVKNRQYTVDNLMAIVDNFAANHLGYTVSTVGNRSKEQIVRDIYALLVNPNKASRPIQFEDSISNTPNQYAQNGQKRRIGWKQDYVEEAYRTLTSSLKRGDCYTFYAVSKAFYEYFGIDNVGIQRSVNSQLGGTHYWNAVNIGTASSPKWYYTDCTPYAGHFSDGSQNACLMTEKSLLSYITSKGESGYYVIEKNDPEFFDAEDNGGKFPVIETTKLG